MRSKREEEDEIIEVVFRDVLENWPFLDPEPRVRLLVFGESVPDEYIRRFPGVRPLRPEERDAFSPPLSATFTYSIEGIRWLHHDRVKVIGHAPHPWCGTCSIERGYYTQLVKKEEERWVVRGREHAGPGELSEKWLETLCNDCRRRRGEEQCRNQNQNQNR